MKERTATSETTEQRESGSCPECGGKVEENPKRGEKTCKDCGLVVEEDEIDHGPEWRAFESEERKRTGASRTNLHHDDLSTNIPWQDRDSNGNKLNSRKRSRLNRLRKRDKRSKLARGREEAKGLGEVSRMTSALGVPDSTGEMAGSLYSQAQDAGLLPGRSIEAMASACVYCACRVNKTPRSLDEVTHVSRVKRKPIFSSYSYLQEELGLAVENVTAGEYVGRAKELEGFESEHEMTARKICEACYETPIPSGKSPTVIAASVVYAVSLIEGLKITQVNIADCFDVTAVSIRNNYNDILDMWLEDDDEEDEDSGEESGVDLDLFEIDFSEWFELYGDLSMWDIDFSGFRSVETDGGYECPHCDRSDFVSERGLNIHIGKTHNGPDEYDVAGILGLINDKDLTEEMKVDIISLCIETDASSRSHLAAVTYRVMIDKGLLVTQSEVGEMFDLTPSAVSAANGRLSDSLFE